MPLSGGDDRVKAPDFQSLAQRVLGQRVSSDGDGEYRACKVTDRGAEYVAEGASCSALDSARLEVEGVLRELWEAEVAYNDSVRELHDDPRNAPSAGGDPIETIEISLGDQTFSYPFYNQQQLDRAHAAQMRIEVSRLRGRQRMIGVGKALPRKLGSGFERMRALDVSMGIGESRVNYDRFVLQRREVVEGGWGVSYDDFGKAVDHLMKGEEKKTFTTRMIVAAKFASDFLDVSGRIERIKGMYGRDATMMRDFDKMQRAKEEEVRRGPGGRELPSAIVKMRALQKILESRS